jgi:hypothetical protein
MSLIAYLLTNGNILATFRDWRRRFGIILTWISIRTHLETVPVDGVHLLDTLDDCVGRGKPLSTYIVVGDVSPLPYNIRSKAMRLNLVDSRFVYALQTRTHQPTLLNLFIETTSSTSLTPSMRTSLDILNNSTCRYESRTQIDLPQCVPTLLRLLDIIGRSNVPGLKGLAATQSAQVQIVQRVSTSTLLVLRTLAYSISGRVQHGGDEDQEDMNEICFLTLATSNPPNSEAQPTPTFITTFKRHLSKPASDWFIILRRLLLIHRHRGERRHI